MPHAGLKRSGGGGTATAAQVAAAAAAARAAAAAGPTGPKAATRPTSTLGRPAPKLARPRTGLGSDHSLTLPNWCSAGPYADDDAELYTTMTRISPAYKVYHNAFWHTHKWYALVPSDKTNQSPAHTSSDSTNSGSEDKTGGLEEGLSVNCPLIRLPVSNISAVTGDLRAGFLPGTTLLVDFPFPAFPDNLGHWAEIMLPTYSVLAGGHGEWQKAAKGRSRFVDRILFTNLRKEVNDWFRELLALAVAPGVRRGGAPVPPIIDHTDLEAFPKLSWLAFENLLVIQDRYTHSERKTGFVGTDHGDLWRYDGCARYVNNSWHIGFSNTQFADEFRAAAYKRAGLSPPATWSPGAPPPTPPSQPPGSPRIFTLLLAHEDYPALVNWEEVQALLRRHAARHGAQARTVTLSTDAPFASHLDTLAASSVVVARHGPLLGTAALMAPGTAVFELLPYKWEWLGISQLYRNMTQTAGSVHHFAWRPQDHNLALYDHANYTRYHTWTPEECSARECLMVHARAGLRAEIQELDALLSAKLPGVLAGQPVDQLAAPWPKAV